ncbi:ABC transporter permease [Nesterenkonia cremea]|uniref:Iron ABC transporter permease n=1 Tax=Nesterenkonia cremea TaxID=1882340 RepID=A0A917AVQ8_9MICC|nr:iron ABC transporter permease [Nesterenkonia cremea]GGE76121.1 iron ABC transporter permease [Nesterenkonia cremea]
MTATQTPPPTRPPRGPVPKPRLSRMPRKPSSFDTLTLVLAFTLIAIVCLPLLQVVIGMVWKDGEFTFEAIERTLALPDLWTLIWNTLVLVIASSVCAVVIGFLLAWVNQRTDARWGLLNDILPYLPFLLPPVAGAVGWIMLLSPTSGLLNVWIRDALSLFGVDLATGPFDIHTWYGLILVYTVYAVPYTYLNISAALESFDSSLEEASRLSGAGYLRTLRRVTLPALAPSVGAGFLLSTWFGFGMFSIAAIIGTPAQIDVIAVRIVNLLTFSYPPDEDLAIGLSAIVMVFVGLSYYIQFRILRSARFGSISGKSTQHNIIRLGPWRPVVRGLVLIYVLGSTVLPMIGLFLVALNGYWTPNIDWGGLSLDAFRSTLIHDPSAREALFNSLGLGIVGGFIGILAASFVSLYVQRRRTALGAGIDAAIKMPASISNMVIAVGILLLLGGDPFNLGGTWLILLIGYLALYLPQASIASDAAVAVVGKDLGEASTVSGARDWKTFLRIYAPLMLPGLIGAWALLFIRIVGDLTASAILSGTENVVLGFRILEVFNGGSYAELAALSSTLVLITGTVLLFVIILSKRFGVAKTQSAPRTRKARR